MKYLILLCLLAMPAAAQVNMSWEQPTEQLVCTQSEPIQGLQGVRIWRLVAEIADPAETEFVITGLGEGEYTFAATAYQADSESILTKQISTLVGAPQVINTAAKVPVRTSNAHILVVAGTVPLGTECLSDQTLNGHNIVPAVAVTWSGTVSSVTAYAECGYL